MATPIDLQQHPIKFWLWALPLSISLHLILVAFLHPFEFDNQPITPPLNIELEKPLKPEPPPLPPPPEPETKPQPKVEPKAEKPIERKPLPAPTPVIQAPTPTPIVQQQPTVETPQPKIIAVAPKAEEPVPVITAPAAAPQPAPQPTQKTEENDEAGERYVKSLTPLLSENQDYPILARKRHMEGGVRVEVEIDAQGNVLSVKVIKSSGKDILDNAAVNTIKKSSPLPPPPNSVRMFKTLINFTLKSE